MPAPAHTFLYASRPGALPQRFRHQRLLIIGCGDIGLRLAALTPKRLRLLALTSTAARLPELRQRGITPLLGNLDNSASLRRLAGLANRIVHLAPPKADHLTDGRTQSLLKALRLGLLPQALVYASTSGVYGDCSGQIVNETRAVQASTARAKRRVDAERQIRRFGRASGVSSSVLRIPGIYAANRAGGTPRQRLLQATPVLCDEDDVYTNHIHADDLARACWLALWRGAAQRVYNVNDDSCLKSGQYFDLAADLYQLPRPLRLSRAQAQQQLAPTLLSFMSESRRMDNRRLKNELRLRLRYPSVAQGLLGA